MTNQINIADLIKKDLSDFLINSNYEVEDSKVEKDSFYIKVKLADDELPCERAYNGLGNEIYKNSEAEIGDETVSCDIGEALSFDENSSFIKPKLCCRYLQGIELDKMSIFDPEETQETEEFNELNVLEGTIDAYLQRTGLYDGTHKGDTVFRKKGKAYLLHVDDTSNKGQISYSIRGQRFTE